MNTKEQIKAGLIAVFLFFLILMCGTGCATPSRIVRTWNSEAVLIKEEIEYKNSTFYSGKAIGLKVGYDTESYSPIVKLIYGRYESARIYEGMNYSSLYGLKDVNFYTGAGEASHDIEMKSGAK